jgi:hypothetical protein
MRYLWGILIDKAFTFLEEKCPHFTLSLPVRNPTISAAPSRRASPLPPAASQFSVEYSDQLCYIMYIEETTAHMGVDLN